jgi:hypothetical protein
MIMIIYVAGFVAVQAAWYQQGVKDGYRRGYLRGKEDEQERREIGE